MYGGTYRLADKVWRRFGLEFSFVDTSKLEVVEKALRPNTKLFLLETPTNPVLGLCDIAALSRLARGRGIRVAVDNTFLSPYFQRPELGADIVVKHHQIYERHSDMGGVVVYDSVWGEARLPRTPRCRPGPWTVVVLRGIKTLAS